VLKPDLVHLIGVSTISGSLGSTRIFEAFPGRLFRRR